MTHPGWQTFISPRDWAGKVISGPPTPALRSCCNWIDSPRRCPVQTHRGVGCSPRRWFSPSPLLWRLQECLQPSYQRGVTHPYLNSIRGTVRSRFHLGNGRNPTGGNSDQSSLNLLPLSDNHREHQRNVTFSLLLFFLPNSKSLCWENCSQELRSYWISDGEIRFWLGFKRAPKSLEWIQLIWPHVSGLSFMKSQQTAYWVL